MSAPTTKVMLLTLDGYQAWKATSAEVISLPAFTTEDCARHHTKGEHGIQHLRNEDYVVGVTPNTISLMGMAYGYIYVRL